MSENACKFMWYELMTTDAAAAKEFYGAVVGWGTETAPPPNDAYTVLKVGNNGIAGLMEISPEMCADARPGWMGYIGVDDTDAYAARIKEAGGAIYREPEDIPGVGRFAVCADPHGAVFNIMTPAPMGDEDCSGDQPPKHAQGTPGWDELHAGNGAEAWQFYSKLFGWAQMGSMDMGDLGEYVFFSENGETPSGAIMTKTPDTPAPFWNYYFNVDDINEATQRIKDNGGQVIMGPHEVPGNTWIVQGIDPQGAMFAFVAQPK